MPHETTLAGRTREFDPEYAYRAVSGRDSRFDGWFITAVRTTGIYCRPSCPATTPKRTNVEFFPTAAAAQSAGYRACRRCLPDAVPGSPEWNLRADLAARAMRLINDGVIERSGVSGLADRLGYSERHLTRVLTAELGAGPLALARAHRAHDARLLIETTELSVTDVAFAAGFASVRQFNDTIRAVFAATPSELRARARRRAPRQSAGRITLRLPFRAPFDAESILDFLAAQAIPGMETVSADGYARTLHLPHGSAVATLQPAAGHLVCGLALTDLRDLGSAVTRLRRLFDLDADPVAVDELLSRDPALAPSVAAIPGLRLPGSVSGDETLLRALLHRVDAHAAATLTEAVGEAVDPAIAGSLTRLFPTATAIAEHAVAILGGAPGIGTLAKAGAALAAGELSVHVGRDPEALRAELTALPGVDAGVADEVLMRVLGAPDVFTESDAALRRGARILGLPGGAGALLARSRSWQPWRSYAGMHLWRAATVGVAAGNERTA
ncbi:MAG TPA: AlkA N-terminal domain-containing protein [Pseudonocardiaceae bacterium]|nr:AlkA N-terminal domain-containing protein [Pseudonocardiaceae bacterium]